MRFGDVHLLWGLLAIPLLVLYLIGSERRRRRDLSRVIASSAWDRLAAEVSSPRRRASAILLVFAVLVLVIGASRPQFGSRVLETRQRGIDVVLAVDNSLSMEARDIEPSRRARARQELLGLLDRLQGDRVALVSFAGQAFLQCPLTLDRGAIQMLLPLLDPSSAPEPGSNIADAIHRGVLAFQDDPRRGRALIILSDGEAFDGDLEKAIEEAKQARVRICAIGIGRTQGEPIPLQARPGASVEFKKDRSGQMVLTRLDETTLKRACEATGGSYVRAETGAASLRIAQALRDLQQEDLEGGLGVRYEERFGYLAVLAVLLLLIEGTLGERRRVA
jgi:Ca-activated chloride channel family protein